MKYVIRKVPERDTSYLERLLPNAMIYSDTEHRGPIESMVEAYRTVNGDAVYVQDNMILCKGFQEKTKEYIRIHPNDVIVFSNFNVKDPDLRREGYYSGFNVGWLLCTYIPWRIVSMFLADWDNGRIRPTKTELRLKYDDSLIMRWLKANGIDCFLTVPNLAGHSANESTIEKRPPRLCWNFDYENSEPGSRDHERTLKYYRENKHKWIGPNGEAISPYKGAEIWI